MEKKIEKRVVDCSDLEYNKDFLPIEESDLMLTCQSTLYEIYVHIYAKVKSGAKMADGDFVFRTGRGAVPFNEKQRIAVAISVSDQKENKPMRTKTSLDEEIDRLLK